jgi:hypothetical protein
MEVETMKVHFLKSWPEFFDAQVSGAKTFEIRRNDRGYEVGDVLILRKWDPGRGDYVPGVVGRRVTYVAAAFLPEGTCAMSTTRLSAEDWLVGGPHIPDVLLAEILGFERPVVELQERRES